MTRDNVHSWLVTIVLAAMVLLMVWTCGGCTLADKPIVSPTAQGSEGVKHVKSSAVSQR